MANFSFILPLTAGAVIATQIALETKTRESIGLLPVAIFAFAFALIACFIWAMYTGVSPVPHYKDLQFSLFFGGSSRIAYLILMTAPLLGKGSADKMCFVVVGQVVVGALIEHFGWFGAKPCRIDGRTILGILGLLFSLLLILKRPCP